MIAKIKNKISEFIAIKKFSQNQNSEKNFKSFFSESKNILIILPKNTNKLSVEVIELIRFIVIHKKKLSSIHNIELQQYLPENLGISSLIIGNSDKNKLALPNTDLVNRIKILTFNLVIDLNIEDDIFSSALSNIPKADFRIGFVKNKSDLFYNYQIPSEINYEKSYRNLVNSLRMF